MKNNEREEPMAIWLKKYLSNMIEIDNFDLNEITVNIVTVVGCISLHVSHEQCEYWNEVNGIKFLNSMWRVSSELPNWIYSSIYYKLKTQKQSLKIQCKNSTSTNATDVFGLKFI